MYLCNVIVKNYDVISLFLNIFILRKPKVANFAEIIKIVNMFFEKIFKDSKKVKRNNNYVPKCSLYLYFLM